MHKRIGFVVSIGSLSGLLFLRATGLCPQLMEHARHIHSAVSVCSEEVALCLRQSSWQTLRTQAIVIGQRAGEHRCRNTCINGGLDDSAPGILGIGKELGEIRIKWSSLLKAKIEKRIVTAIHQIGGAKRQRSNHQNWRHNLARLFRQLLPDIYAQRGGSQCQNNQRKRIVS